MKTTLTWIFLSITLTFYAQRSKKAWHNHENYKEEVIEAIRKSPELLNPELYFKSSGAKNIFTSKNSAKSIDFVNGINIAWVAFGRDIGKDPEFGTEYHPDFDQFAFIMDKVSNAGGNVLRWWYHTNGSTNPTFDEHQKVTENPVFFHDDVIELLDLAAEKGLQLQICLWSFDMLKDQWNVDAAANKKLLTEDEYFKAYIENALVPLVNAVGEHPGLYAWEIFNEAEGMTTEFGSHWPGFLEKISIMDVQRFVNRAAAAIRSVQPNVKVTNGSLGFLTNVEDPEKGYENYYTDQKLESVGGNANGYLDFYNVHYYNWAGEQGSPFHNTFDAQKIDKSAVIAEYYPDYTYGIDIENMAVTLKDNGWKGSFVWSWTDRTWDVMEPIIINSASQILSVTDTVDHHSSVIIAPNPVRNILSISRVKKESNIRIYDATGKTIVRSVVHGDFNQIDLTAISKGVYYIALDKEVVKKIVKL